MHAPMPRNEAGGASGPADEEIEMEIGMRAHAASAGRGEGGVARWRARNGNAGPIPSVKGKRLCLHSPHDGATRPDNPCAHPESHVL